MMRWLFSKVGHALDIAIAIAFSIIGGFALLIFFGLHSLVSLVPEKK